MKKYGIYTLLCLLFFACADEPYFVPKPRIYPRVEYPERVEQRLEKDYCAFSFSYPDYMLFEQDTLLINRPSLDACWFNLKMPNFNGELHFTYTPLRKDSLEKDIYKVYNDAYRLAMEHNIKASTNEDLQIYRPEERIYGVLFNIEGHVASPFQFILTDSSEHALRAALYFNTSPNPDSMQPIIEFVKVDMMQMINSFSWQEKSK